MLDRAGRARIGKLANARAWRAFIRSGPPGDGGGRPCAGASMVMGLLMAWPSIQLILGHAVLPPLR
jgi:hypothetical protein